MCLGGLRKVSQLDQSLEGWVQINRRIDGEKRLLGRGKSLCGNMRESAGGSRGPQYCRGMLTGLMEAARDETMSVVRWWLKKTI